MTEEQLKNIIEEQQRAGAPLSLLTQMRFAYELDLPEETYDLLIQTEDFEIREWLRISLMEGIPLNEVRQYQTMNIKEIQTFRRRYFLKKENVEELKEIREQTEKKLQKLELLVDKTEPMERYIHVLLKQKDKMLDTCQKQLESLRRKTEKLEEQLELWQRLSEPSRQTFPPKEDKEELPPEPKALPSVLPEPEPIPWWAFCRRKKRRKETGIIAEYLKQSSWSREQMEFILECLEEHMTMEDIKQITGPEMEIEKMRLLKRMIQKDYRKEE